MISQKYEIATFGAGCFWGVEDLFGKVKGVKETTVGYMGGTMEHPTYEDVCTNQTGHAEVCQVTFDPHETTYEKLLDAFWNMHDPTTMNRQGPDVGSQYRSVIFTHTPEQQAAAEKSKAALEASKKYLGPIVTQIIPAPTFWPAEEYHQDYFTKHPGAACHI
jgi:peptide-methionine (S)-S-oxide reductase